MKITRKILKYAFYILLVLLILTISPIITFQKEPNHNPLQSFYKKGVYHLHSVFSDGTGTVDHIAGAASRAKLDFAILTDHGEPNLESSRSTAWFKDVLLIGGSEFSLNCGHLAAVGFQIPDHLFPPEPQPAIDAVNRDKGLSFISHPFDDKIPWTDWDVKDFTGLEVLSCYSSARKAGLTKILSFPFRYLFSSDYALLSTLEYPEENLKRWDELNGAGRHYGIYALDAHGELPLFGNTHLSFPSYEAMFKILTLYVRVEEELVKDARQSAATIISALKKGHFFNVVEAIAPANGFEAYFLSGEDRRSEMGDTVYGDSGKIVIKLPFEFKTGITVKKDGEVFKQITDNLRKTLEVEIRERGVYRLEIFAGENKFRKLPWILTNPFFIGVHRHLPFETKPGVKTLLAKGGEFFRVEKNRASRGVLTATNTENNGWTFTYKLAKEPDREDSWVALARRERLDLSAHEGFVFDTRSGRETRFWLEFRCETDGSETWYRHSFLSGKEWKTIHIPFEKFHPYAGKNKNKTGKPPLSRVNALFFAVNNAIAYPGTEGSIQLKNLGLY